MSKTFLIFNGNNTGLIRDALLRRSWWKNAVDDDAEMFTEAPEDIDPTALARRKADLMRIREAQEARLLEQSFDFCWNPTLGLKLRNGGVVNLHSLDYAASSPQLVNHFSSIKCLTSKTGLLRSLVSFYTAAGLDPFEFTPTTFIVKGARFAQRSDGSDYTQFLQRFKEIGNGYFGNERLAAKHCLKNMWIVKPAFLNQGRGIQVFSEISKIKQHLHNVGDDEEWLVQKYIERPFLVWGRKFDFRIWVLVTDAYDIYMYEDGYIRTSSEQFTLDLRTTGSKAGAPDSKMVHLTNYCMQKHSKNLGKFEEGNTLKLDDLQDYINEHCPGVSVSVRNDIMTRMKELVLDSLLSVRNSIDTCNKGRRCFELFGYDFMLDEDFRCWLIEVNTNPYLGVQNGWHGELLQRMIEDMVRLAIDPVYPPPPGATVPPTPRRTVPVGGKPVTSPIVAPSSGGAAAAGIPDMSLPASRTSSVAASTRKNGWELLYTEKSPAAMAGTRHAQAIAADAIPSADIPVLASPTPPASKSGFCINESRKLRRRSATWHYPAGVPKVPPEVLAAMSAGAGAGAGGDGDTAGESLAFRKGKRKKDGGEKTVTIPPEPSQPTPFDYVSSMAESDRVFWCLDMLQALFAAKSAPIHVSTVSVAGNPVNSRQRSVSTDLESSLEISVDASAALESSAELAPAAPATAAPASSTTPSKPRLSQTGKAGSGRIVPPSPVAIGRSLKPSSAGGSRPPSTRQPSPGPMFTATPAEDKPFNSLSITDYQLQWTSGGSFVPTFAPTVLDALLSPTGAASGPSPAASESKMGDGDAPAAPQSAAVVKLGPGDIANTDTATQRKAMSVCFKYLLKASKDLRYQEIFAKNAFCAIAWELLVSYAKLGRGARNGLAKLMSDTCAQSVETALVNLMNAFKKHARIQRDMLLPPMPSLVNFAVLPALVAACAQKPPPVVAASDPPSDAPSVLTSPVRVAAVADAGAGRLDVLEECTDGDDVPDAKDAPESAMQAAAESALSEVGPLELTLCQQAFRFLSAVAEKSRLLGNSRQLMLSCGALHAALFASFTFPPASGLRRMGLELLRSFRRKDLDELSAHMKFHENMGRSSLTTSGCVFCLPCELPFPAHLRSAAFSQVVGLALEVELELRNKQILRSVSRQDDKPVVPPAKREPSLKPKLLEKAISDVTKEIIKAKKEKGKDKSAPAAEAGDAVNTAVDADIPESKREDAKPATRKAPSSASIRGSTSAKKAKPAGKDKKRAKEAKDVAVVAAAVASLTSPTLPEQLAPTGTVSDGIFVPVTVPVTSSVSSRPPTSSKTASRPPSSSTTLPPLATAVSPATGGLTGSTPKYIPRSNDLSDENQPTMGGPVSLPRPKSSSGIRGATVSTPSSARQASDVLGASLTAGALVKRTVSNDDAGLPPSGPLSNRSGGSGSYSGRKSFFDKAPSHVMTTVGDADSDDE